MTSNETQRVWTHRHDPRIPEGWEVYHSKGDPRHRDQTCHWWYCAPEEYTEHDPVYSEAYLTREEAITDLVEWVATQARALENGA